MLSSRTMSDIIRNMNTKCSVSAAFHMSDLAESDGDYFLANAIRFACSISEGLLPFRASNEVDDYTFRRTGQRIYIGFNGDVYIFPIKLTRAIKCSKRAGEKFTAHLKSSEIPNEVMRVYLILCCCSRIDCKL